MARLALATVRVLDPTGGVVTINATDFDPRTHRLAKDQPAPAPALEPTATASDGVPTTTERVGTPITPVDAETQWATAIRGVLDSLEGCTDPAVLRAVTAAELENPTGARKGLVKALDAMVAELATA
jgi:hypothetical protein